MINQNTVRKVDMPANLFSNLGGKDFLITNELPQDEPNIIKTNNELAEDMKEYYQSGDIKLNKYNNAKPYRNRLDKIYEQLSQIKPIDNEIKDTIFTNNYIEKGIVIKPTIQELKQLWTEYRLMNNEKKNNIKEENILYKNPVSIYTSSNEEKTEFDELFDKLTKKVDEINLYIGELKEMRDSVDKKNEEIQKNKETLELDRQQFLNYKQEEEEKIRNEKEKLRNNFNKLQNIIDNLDTKLNEV